MLVVDSPLCNQIALEVYGEVFLDFVRDANLSASHLARLTRHERSRRPELGTSGKVN
jgi:hypothetical protein